MAKTTATTFSLFLRFSLCLIAANLGQSISLSVEEEDEEETTTTTIAAREVKAIEEKVLTKPPNKYTDGSFSNRSLASIGKEQRWMPNRNWLRIVGIFLAPLFVIAALVSITIMCLRWCRFISVRRKEALIARLSRSSRRRTKGGTKNRTASTKGGSSRQNSLNGGSGRTPRATVTRSGTNLGGAPPPQMFASLFGTESQGVAFGAPLPTSEEGTTTPNTSSTIASSVNKSGKSSRHEGNKNGNNNNNGSSSDKNNNSNNNNNNNNNKAVTGDDTGEGAAKQMGSSSIVVSLADGANSSKKKPSLQMVGSLFDVASSSVVEK